MKLEENKRKMRQRKEGMMIQAPYHGYHPAPTGSEPNTNEMNPIRKIYGWNGNIPFIHLIAR